MTLQLTQYYPAPSAFDAQNRLTTVASGPPAALDNLANGASVTIGGADGNTRLVRILAKVTDHDVVWPSGASETFKVGIPEFRLVTPGSVMTCAAAS